MIDQASTQVVVKTPFVCAGCHQPFYDRHSCPSMPWQSSAPRLVYEAGAVYTITGFTHA